MTDKKHPCGIWAAALTALEDNGALDVKPTVWHWRWLLEAGGCAGVVPFGTTGEGPSLSGAERVRALEAALADGIDTQRLWPGTGGASLDETIELTRRVRSLGFPGALILPPFFYPSDDEGLAKWYGAVFESLDADGGGGDFGVLLYNIPKLSRSRITLPLVSSVLERFPHRLVGVKDSDGEWDHLSALTRDFPDLGIMCGDERLLLRHARNGGAGGILARACIAGDVMSEMFAAGADGGDSDGDGAAEESHDFLVKLREAIAPYGTIPALKHLAGRQSGAAGDWHPRAPLLPLAAERGEALRRDIAALGARGEALLARFGGL
ncbi:MAG: dihydrodipicolinate synthase family protein [Alphaproteobacteria bacterium]|nr:dihydrodipicolinate synthase family protein [Alphaproteobacteria bacterium]